jgi:predicted aspartyl protease
VPAWTGHGGDLRTFGPRVQVTIGLTDAASQALTASGGTVPTPVSAQALIDTGASGSVITKHLAEQLGLQPVGTRLVNTASGVNVQTTAYAVRLSLSPEVYFETTATEAEEIRAQGLDVLIGRDVLSRAVFVYIGYMNQFTIAV